VLDTDLSATLQADRLFCVEGPTPYALHLELESTGRLGIPEERGRGEGKPRHGDGLLPGAHPTAVPGAVVTTGRAA
jgi:hypothetical protein